MATTDARSDWRTSANPDVLLNAVWPRPQAYDAPFTRDLPSAVLRRLRLYGVACARMVWDVLPTDARNAVLLSERFANGRATHSDLRAAAVRVKYAPVTFQQQAASSAAWAAGYRAATEGDGEDGFRPCWDPAVASHEAAKALATRAAGPVPPAGKPAVTEWHVAWNGAYFIARAHQAELVRDIFPPPGYATGLRSDWRTSTVVALARQMDAAGEYSAVPILADALQDAGCDNDMILDRCRTPSGVHCRGNWVVDSVLGRE